jgi:alpha-tubulin suppressor-like RCC1 family protein
MLLLFLLPAVVACVQGWNARGTLGHGHRDPQDKPQRVAGLQGVHIKQAAIGGWHVLALDDTGQCWAWGEPLLLSVGKKH